MTEFRSDNSTDDNTANGNPASNVVSLPSAADIDAEAAAWLTVLGRDAVSEGDRAAFGRWLKASDRNRAAFEALRALWDDMAVLRELDDIAEATHGAPSGRRPLFRRRSFMAAAASLLAFATAGGAYYASQQGRVHQQASFATAVGEQRTFDLADGSRLQLNTDSRAEAVYSRTARIVRLTAGEAYFEVEKDAQRPFVVHAADGVVEAVGTAFTVRLHGGDAVEVTVEEGRVAIASSLPNAKAPEGREDAPPAPFAKLAPLAQLTAGQSVVFGERVEAIAHMDEPALKRKLSWRQGMLAYSGDPLASVIADISRYTDVVIEIDDPALGEKPVAGYFRAGEVEALLDSLELSFGLNVERVNDKLVRLSAAS